MTNPLGVCLLFAAFLCCTNVSYARQVPKECSKGPSYWCQNLKTASDCGAVAHCVSTVWETQSRDVSKDEISDKIVKLFRDLKDVKDLINEDYLATRVRSTCSDLPYPVASRICRENTANLEKYILHVLQSNVSAADMCTLISMCNNNKIDNIISLNHKKTAHVSNKGKLLGGERCTWGPSYWCSNISTGHECGATRHCIDRVWSKMSVQKDNDSICQICLDMVKQARDQLESNETQEELREVFEGSCKLIPVKLVAKECMKLADEFIPDLVETLASQMNPHTVCSVAGLCNNADIDVLLEGYNRELSLRTECNNCETTIGVLRKRYDNTDYKDFLVNLLTKCRDMDSFSDACSTLVFKYYENIRAAIDQDFNSRGVCALSGQCSYRQIHSDLYNFPPAKEVKADDDIPCEFCEQLVVHLRDIFVANTTGTEVQKVLTALCKRTGNFKDECLHLLDEYYPIIYNYIVSGLQPKQICSLVGVCTDKLSKVSNVPIAPLLPAEMKVSVMTPGVELIGQEEAKINAQPIETEVNIGPVVALPLERMFPVMPQTKAQCAFCQYFLHYLQVELSDTRTEDKIRNLVDKACDRLPQSVEEECKSFVDGYGPAVIAMLVQEIDPSVVCPSLGLCPSVDTTQVRHVDINSEKSNCPLCLFAVEQLEAMLKNNRTETSIRLALDNLCTHLSQKLRTECMDFVDTYSNQLVEMLVANMDAQEICVYLKLCSDNSKKVDPLGVRPIDWYHDKPFLRSDLNKRRRPMLPKHMLEGGDIETNEIPDHTVNGRPVHVQQKTVCVVCEFVMKEIDDAIKDKHNEDDIKKIVHSVCRRMPKSVQDQCDNFVEKYADLIISLLEQQLQPDEVCQEIKLCDPTNKLSKVQVEILDCAVCETVVMAVKKVLSNDKTDRNIVHVVEKSCSLLPTKYRQRCHTMMEIYGDSVIHLIEDIGTKGVCEKIGLCADNKSGLVHMYRDQH